MSRTLEPTVLLVGMDWFGDRPGGLNRYLADLLRALRGIDVPARAVVTGPANDAPSEVVSAACDQLPLVRRLIAIRRAAVRSGSTATVVDAHFALHAALPLFTSRLGRLPLVVHFQGPWADESVASRGQYRVAPIKRAVERAVYARAARAVVLSNAFGRVLAESYAVDPQRIVVVPPGVDLERFTPGDQSTARDAFGLATDTFVAVAARRLDPRMGLDTLIRAWADVQTGRPGAVLLVAGDGPEWGRLDGLRRLLADPEGVRLLGHVSDEQLVLLYRAADCSVVPTRALEGFGLVVLESLACGTPCIVTNVGGLPEAVEGFDDSLVLPPDEPRALADRLLEAAAGRVPGPEACRAHAERFRWSDVARRHLEIYRDVAEPRPKVVYLDHCAQLSGGELALLKLLPAMAEIDRHVILAEDGPLVAKLAQTGASVEVLPMPERARGLSRNLVRPGRVPGWSALYTATYIARLARRLRSLRPDLVHTNSLKAAIYGGLAARIAGIPVVWDVKDRIADDYLPSSAGRLVRALARRLPIAVIANSKATLESLGSAVSSIPTAVVPGPVSLGPSPAGEAFQKPRNAVLRVGIVGRLMPWKGQHLFLDAFSKAFPEGDALAVVVGSPMFGEEEYEIELKDQIERLGLGERVELRGFREDIAAEMNRLDVLVHASLIPEPFGNVVVEGMAAGLPVLAPAAGGPAEIITDGVDGLLYPMGDAVALAGRLRDLATNPGLRRKLGDAGRRRAADFSPDRAAAAVIELYRRVLGDRWPGQRDDG